MTARAFCAALLLLGGIGCDRRSEETVRAQQQAARLGWIEDRIRNASNAEKSSFLTDLASAPCPAPDACAMRDTCVSGYTLHVDALKLTSAAKQLVADGRDTEAASILGAAETKLKEAGAKIGECTSLASSLRRSYSVN